MFKHSSPEKELSLLTSNDGATPLHIAVSGGQIELALNILSHGADVNAKNNNGDTPLHLAMAFPGDLLARALLSYGADLAIKNNAGKKPSQVAHDRGNQPLSDLMVEYENNLDSLPDPKDIQKELSLKEVERIKKFTYTRNNIGTGAVASSKLNELEGRIQVIEDNIEKIFDILTNLRLTPSQAHNVSTICASCSAPNASECPLCHNMFCETCMKQPSKHHCVTEK